MKTAEEDVRALLNTIWRNTFQKWTRRETFVPETREIFYNQQLPERLINHKTGHNKVIYERNKIRTTKYTPLNFVPLNIFFQFTNIANSYFLFIIILGCFQIFGVQNPAMQAVPLIVIVVLTAIKDLVEDSRRAISDLDMNSSKVHKLVGIQNNNAAEDYAGPWRRFKKATTRQTIKVLRLFKRKKKKQNANTAEEEMSKESMDLYTLRSNTLSTINSKEGEMDLHNPLRFKTTQWKNVMVGDILRIRKNEEIPSDVLLLKSSNQNNVCYIETKNLDGETNLKTKQAMDCSSRQIHKLLDLGRMKFTVESEQPTKDLYSFHGVAHFEDVEGIQSPTSEAITIDNVLLRGSVLRNTNYVICIVLATGSETKIMLNSGVTPTKKSKISSNLNYFVLINFCLLFILCFVSGLINGLYYRDKTQSRLFFEYAPDSPTNAGNGTLAFFVTLIMYQTLVPISLYITIEIIKTFQVFFIYSDVQMYYERLDFPCTPKSWGISDDLGQIEYIFSDKTGTLTQNIMEFKKCAIADKSYGLAYTAAQEGYDKRMGNVDIAKKKAEIKASIKQQYDQMCKALLKRNPFLKPEKLTFISSKFVDEIEDRANQDFLLALSLCHCAVIEHEDLENMDDGTIINYSAESPDEVALVSFARDMGVVFLGKENDEYIVYQDGTEHRYKLLNVIPFTSARKRMSIVLEFPDGTIRMYMKGADNIILQRCVKGEFDSTINENLEEFSEEGLRTLCVSYKDLRRDEFDSWYERYFDASKLLDEQREIQMSQLADEFEQGVKLIGATAIDDKLQDNVPQTIETLRRAGIKIWVLTGDKVETAISIGYSCSMLNNNMDLLRLQCENIEELEKTVDNYLVEKFNITDVNDPKLIKAARKDHSIPNYNHALLIDGQTLTLLFEECELEIQLKFLMLCKKCCSVLCCRVSPSQKADIVRLVKDNLNVITLAIGDGANDVSMIQAANVGVGIAGEEGRQAAMSSDFALGQFEYLQRLLLVHGKWSYQRLSKMIPLFFFKNMIFVMPLFWYGIFNNFDGSYLYEYTFLMLFNLFFTSVPIIALATLEQDVPDYVCLIIPQLYRDGIESTFLKHVFRFLYGMFDGLYQSAIAFFFPWLAFRTGGIQTRNGLSIASAFSVGTYSVHIAIISCNLYMILKQKRWDKITVWCNIVSNLLLFIWTACWSTNKWANKYFQIGLRCYQSANFWACVAVGILCAMIPGLMIHIIKVNWFPDDVDMVRSMIGFSILPNKSEEEKHRQIEVAKRICGYDDNDEDTDSRSSEKV
ncbi:unnamed protein product [Pichia kudriavzevii]